MKKGGAGRIFTPFGITQLVLLAVVGIALWLAYTPWRWEQTKDALHRRFPSIRQISADGHDSLAEWLGKTGEPKPVIIDVRPQAEYDFSRLPGAKHMALSDTPVALGIPVATEESLVIYDAVGADSFPVAENLLKSGYARVQVLEGGIFEWANHGLPLEGPQGPQSTVKVGNSKFASLLNRRARAD